MISRYKRVLEELRNKTGKLASEYIPQLYFILRNEERLSAEDCRARIEHDCEDIWTEDTIRKYLPPETKSATKRKAGKISAEVKKKKKQKEPKLLVAIAADTGQHSEVLDNDCGTGDNSVGINPTENSSFRQKERESKTFQDIMKSQHPVKVFSDDHYSSLVADRHIDELRELLENLSLDECINECVNKSLLLPSWLAEQIYLDVNEIRISGNIPDFELGHDGIRVMSVRKFGKDENECHTHTLREFASEISADVNAAATADSKGINESREEESSDTTAAAQEFRSNKNRNDNEDDNDSYRSKHLDKNHNRLRRNKMEIIIRDNGALAKICKNTSLTPLELVESFEAALDFLYSTYDHGRNEGIEKRSFDQILAVLFKQIFKSSTINLDVAPTLIEQTNKIVG